MLLHRPVHAVGEVGRECCLALYTGMRFHAISAHAWWNALPCCPPQPDS